MTQWYTLAHAALITLNPERQEYWLRQCLRAYLRAHLYAPPPRPSAGRWPPETPPANPGTHAQNAATARPPQPQLL